MLILDHLKHKNFVPVSIFLDLLIFGVVARIDSPNMNGQLFLYLFFFKAQLLNIQQIH